MKLTKLAALSRPASGDMKSIAERGKSGASELLLDEPIFILTCPRSGSTLLRLLLDAHPRLACPPETNVAQWCEQLWSTWSLLDPDCSQERLTEEALQHIRSTVSVPFAAYLRHYGKARWCDKSLGTAQYADQIKRIYKKAKFICLYRHAMDMINSGLEATPWGLTGYGFDRYSSSSPNSVSALAENWIQSTAATLNFEKANPDICARVYYEQLARDPEAVMNSVFDFLGVDAVPGIANSALANRSTGKYEIGDHKIRTSSQITTASVGTGIRVPSHLMPSGQRKVMNQFLGRLGYAEVDRSWRMSITPPEPFATSNRQAPSTIPAADHAQEPAVDTVKDSLKDAFAAADVELRHRIPRQIASLPTPISGWTSVAIAAYSAEAPANATVWLIDRLSGKINSCPDTIDFESCGADWVVTSDIDTWQAVLCGRENMAKATRQGYIRFIGKASADDGDDGDQVDPSMQTSDFRLETITYLLGS